MSERWRGPDGKTPRDGALLAPSLAQAGRPCPQYEEAGRSRPAPMRSRALQYAPAPGEMEGGRICPPLSLLSIITPDKQAVSSE